MASSAGTSTTPSRARLKPLTDEQLARTKPTETFQTRLLTEYFLLHSSADPAAPPDSAPAPRSRRSGPCADREAPWRLRDQRRAILEKISPRHRVFLEQDPTHRVVLERFPARMTPAEFVRRLLLITYHLVLKTGTAPSYWQRSLERGASERLLRYVPAAELESLVPSAVAAHARLACDPHATVRDARASAFSAAADGSAAHALAHLAHGAFMGEVAGMGMAEGDDDLTDLGLCAGVLLGLRDGTLR